MVFRSENGDEGDLIGLGGNNVQPPPPDAVEQARKAELTALRKSRGKHKRDITTTIGAARILIRDRGSRTMLKKYLDRLEE